MSPEPFVSRAKAMRAKRSEKGYGDRNEKSDIGSCPVWAAIITKAIFSS